MYKWLRVPSFPSMTPARSALYVAEGEIELAGQIHRDGRLLVLHTGDVVSAKALKPSRIMLLGG
jgi:redox-sensitive bicupin YhaK (pirin superfamily)